MSLRQERLSNLFGSRASLCYSAFICYRRYQFSAKEFDDLAETHGMRGDDGFELQIPSKSFGERLFNPGMLIKTGDTRIAQQVNVQSVFTKTSYLRPGAPVDEDHATQLTRQIADLYKPQIEKHCDNVAFGDELYAQTENFGIEFKYAVHSYDPEICHPAHIGLLRPITIIDGKKINPIVFGLAGPRLDRS